MAILIEAVYGIELNDHEANILSNIDESKHEEMFVEINDTTNDYDYYILGVNLGQNVYDPLYVHNIKEILEEAEKRIKTWLNSQHNPELDSLIQAIKLRNMQEYKDSKNNPKEINDYPFHLYIYAQNI